MCGICGVVTWAPEARRAEARAVVHDMLQRLQHRAPQGSAMDVSEAATFGAGRLAIRGLDDGRQPMLEAESGVIAICNGEIDNHQELRAWLATRGRTVEQQTDVAVIVPLYLELGERFVERLVGVFAIALYDPRKGQLLLVRDRAGERSLYYRQDDARVSFASEAAALAGQRIATEVDRVAVAQYLREGCFAAPLTPWRQLRKLRPGELVLLTARGSTARRWWTWPVVESEKRPPSVDAFDQVFRAAVARQSDIDVEYGLFLSGGLDSSLVAAVARSLRPERRPRAYTIRFAEASYDEGEHAVRAAEHLGLELVQVEMRAEDFPGELEHLIELTGEPLADPAWVPTALLARRAAQDVRLVLSGEGADELFGGYPTYLGAHLAPYYERLPQLLRRWIKRALAAVPPSDRKVPVSYLLQRFVAAEGMDGFARHLLWTSILSPALLAELGVAPPERRAAEAGALLDRVQRRDFETTLGDGLLTKADRGGMSEGLEIRAPFLDREVMAFAATLPPAERVSGFDTKRFLKRYAERYLPRAIVHRRKRGLSVPLAQWLRGPLQSWAVQRLADNRLDLLGLSAKAARRLLADHADGRADHARALWSLLVLDQWLASSAVRQTELRLAG